MHLNIRVTRKFFILWKSKNKVFRHEKTPKSHKNIKMFLKKNFPALFSIKNDWSFFVSWTCWDPSAHTDVFKKLLGPKWLCGGLINLNLREGRQAIRTLIINPCFKETNFEASFYCLHTCGSTSPPLIFGKSLHLAFFSHPSLTVQQNYQS